MKIAVAIFAKTIGLSPVKTRLASTIGRKRAETFYALSIACINEMMSAAAQTSKGEVFPYWALAEENGPELFSGSGFPMMWTGEGDLGTRLATVSQTLFDDHDGVVLIGTDSPQLDAQCLTVAFNLMKKDVNQFVVGPARDGGFYLFGTLQPVSREIWESVTYSTHTTLKELLSKFGDQPVQYLPEEQDVDVAEDLLKLQENLSGKENLLSASQKQLLGWLRANHGLF